MIIIDAFFIPFLQAADALGIVPFKPTKVVVKEKVPYFNLKV
jgi:hypothetical protein